MSKRQSQQLTLRKIVKNLKGEKINFQKNGNIITAQKKKTTGEGHKVEIKLTLEEHSGGSIVGHVRGFGRPLISVPADMAITAYKARISVLR